MMKWFLISNFASSKEHKFVTWMLKFIAEILTCSGTLFYASVVVVAGNDKKRWNVFLGE